MALLTEKQLQKIHSEVSKGKDQLDAMDYLMDIALEEKSTVKEKEAFFLGYVACLEYTRFFMKNKLRGL